jgi:hypothetical protein
MLGEKEVLVSDFSYPTLVFIKDILKKRQLGELTEGALALNVEVVRKFYANYKLFNLDDHFITSTIIRKLYELFEITDPNFFYKGIEAPSKTEIGDLFVGPKGLKWFDKSRSLPLNTMLLICQLLEKKIC